MAYHISKDELLINHEEHTKLADAVLQRDTQKAIALMHYHINGPIEEVIQKFQENNLF